MKNQILKKIYRAVVYLRLSDEDGDNRESDSMRRYCDTDDIEATEFGKENAVDD